MTFDELYSKILEILPEATLGEDNDGQIIVYTNKMTVNGLTGELTSDLVDMTEDIS